MPAFGIQYKLGVDGISLALVVLTTTLTGDQHPGQLRADHGAREGVHDLLPRARGRHDRRLPRARHVPLLHLLGDRPRPDVPDHRHLGRREPHLRDDQVRPVHARRIAAHAGRDPGHRLHLPDRRPARGRARSTTRTCAASASTRRSSSSPSPASSWHSRSRCPCSRSIPGCPMRTSRRRPPARSSWPGFCSSWARTACCASTCRCSRTPRIQWAPLIIILSLIAIVYGAIVALVQPDLKKLVAYSSVSHMGFVTLGIFIFQEQGDARAQCSRWSPTASSPARCSCSWA